MEITKILSADVLDIIFEGRNKSYGAYELRKSYSRRLMIAITVMLSVLLLLIGGYIFANMSKKETISGVLVPKDLELTIIEPEDKPVEPPPVKEPPPMKQIETKQFTQFLVTKDDQVKPEEVPPTMDDLEDVKIGTANVDGLKDDGVVAPPSDDAAGKGVVLPPKKEDPYDDGIFRKVEIESSYPGGPAAWARFLNRNLMKNMPQDALDNGIQGRVEIQFVVDTSGNVSNIEALNGPPELHEAVINVIRKSGKWEPAIQNGKKVRSYKRQPVIIKLEEQ
ncbi:energy transducer TonB [Paraflavitalea pollutisoli]|uniref:energy transducer TonB n=1 Tax=Paraflavitalea pollutisoli TaxID=3034143 RepID=UPI0023EAFB36|nr:energy transducer TonB [Paraflavitalea sp. H1-2-19X]